MPQTILVVDDEARIVKLVRDYLERAGFAVLGAHDGETALTIARREHPDLIVLDLMLPGADGLDVCRRLRRESGVPIIMLTARVEEADRIVGLELGADDFIVKPFGVKEVVARIRAVTRRCRAATESAGPDPFHMGDLEVFPRELRARRDPLHRDHAHGGERPGGHPRARGQRGAVGYAVGTDHCDDALLFEDLARQHGGTVPCVPFCDESFRISEYRVCAP